MRKLLSILFLISVTAFSCRNEDLNPLRKAQESDKGPNLVLALDASSAVIDFTKLATSILKVNITSAHPELISKVEVLLLARFTSNGKTTTVPASPTPYAAGTESLGAVYKTYSGDQAANTSFSLTGSDVQTFLSTTLTTSSSVVIKARITTTNGRVFIPTDNVGQAANQYNPPTLVMQALAPVVCPIPFPAGNYTFTSNGISSGGTCKGVPLVAVAQTGTVAVTLPDASTATFSADRLSLQRYWYFPCQTSRDDLFKSQAGSIKNVCTNLTVKIGSVFPNDDATGTVTWNAATKTITITACEAGDCTNDQLSITLVQQ